MIGNCFLTDSFLGGEFSKYGVQAASFLESQVSKQICIPTQLSNSTRNLNLFLQPFERIDPMSRVFPRVTKCTFRKFGPSGTIQRHDAQCVLPINIINEKIYVFLWFWFCLLSALTILNMLWSLGIVFADRARSTIIKRKLKTS